MLLIGGHDYYDSVIRKTGVDKTVVYNREEKEIGISFKEMNMVLPQWHRRDPKASSFRENISRLEGIVFCGKLYPFVRVRGEETVPGNPWEHNYHISYDIANIRHEYEEHHRVDDTHGKYTRDHKSQQLIKEWDELTAAINRNQTELCIKYKTPIIYVHTANLDDGRRYIVVNPNLKQFKFQQVKDPFTAYQEIYAFVSGVLTNSMPEPKPTTDKQHAAAAGFDTKISFRRESHQRKHKK